MYYKILLVFIISFINYHDNYGQCNEKELIQSIAEYRRQVIENSKPYIPYLRITVHKLDSILLTPDCVPAALYSLRSSSNTSSNRNSIFSNLSNCYNEDLTCITDEELNALLKNEDLINLIYNGVLDVEYPYNINKDAILLKRICFYNIQKDDKIGVLSTIAEPLNFLSLFTYPNNIYRFNSFGPERERAKKAKKINTKGIWHSSSKHSTKGHRRSYIDIKKATVINQDGIKSRVENKSLDMTIVWGFQRIIKYKPILTYLRQALKTNGYLYVLSGAINPNSCHSCGTEEFFTREEIIEYITENGFKYIAENINENVINLKFQRD